MTAKEKSELQKAVVDATPANAIGRWLLAPRCGKTKVAIDYIKRENPASILWVTPSAELADMNNMKDGIVSEFHKWKAKRYIPKLQTVTWMSLDKIEGYYDLIILDEEQFATENNITVLLDKTVSYTSLISMTGTATKHKEKQELYRRLGLKPIYNISINEAVDIGLLSNYTIKVVEVGMSLEKNISAGNKSKQFMTSEQAQYSYLNNIANQAIYQRRKDAQFRILNRMRFIKKSGSKHLAAQFLIDTLQGRKLIFTGGIDQAEELCDYTYHSKTDNEHLLAFKNGEIDELALVNSGGTGHTYKAIDHLILVQADSDKNGLTSQKICRTLLDQKDYKATIWIVTLIGTQDEKWVDATLQSFDKKKIEYIRFKNLKNQQL
jgi:superfamily II DNA or RNA helicase